jgi:hypothetical protein
VAGLRSRMVAMCFRSTAVCSRSGSRSVAACWRSMAVCFGPRLRTATRSKARVKNGGVLEDGKRRWCPGCRDDNRWKFLEILLSVGRERAMPEILEHKHSIGDTHL